MFRYLQTCRAVAALLIVIYHLGAVIALPKYFGAGWLAPNYAVGYAGFTFFAVLSGFVIVHVHWPDIGNPERLWLYLKKRLVRIYPVYWIIFFGVVVAALPFPGLREALPTDAFVLLKSVLLLPQNPHTVGGTGAPVVIVAWSLQYEVVFYAVMGAFILSRYLGLSILAAFALLYVFEPFNLFFLREFLQNDLVLLFLVGAIFAAINRVFSGSLAYPYVWTAIGLVLFFVNVTREIVDPTRAVDVAMHLVDGTASAVIICGLVHAEAGDEASIFKLKWSVLLGDSSYALYLIHFPMFSAICKIAILAGFSRAPGAIGTYLIGIVVCVVASVLFHLRIEKPLLKKMRGWVLGPR